MFEFGRQRQESSINHSARRRAPHLALRISAGILMTLGVASLSYADYGSNFIRALQFVSQDHSEIKYTDKNGISHRVRSLSKTYSRCGQVPFSNPLIITDYGSRGIMTLTDIEDRFSNGIVDTVHKQDYKWSPDLSCFRWRRQH